MSNIEKMYELAHEQYAALGVDTEAAIEQLAEISVSMHCWQGDDVQGFENPDSELTGGIAVTGNYPGKARSPEQLRSDIEQAMSLIPGKQRFNLHASYAETGGKSVERTRFVGVLG